MIENLKFPQASTTTVTERRQAANFKDGQAIGSTWRFLWIFQLIDKVLV